MSTHVQCQSMSTHEKTEVCRVNNYVTQPRKWQNHRPAHLSFNEHNLVNSYITRSPIFSIHSQHGREGEKHQDQTGLKYSSEGITAWPPRNPSPCKVLWDSRQASPKATGAGNEVEGRGMALLFPTRIWKGICYFSVMRSLEKSDA